MQVTVSSYKKDFPNCTVGFNWTSQILNILLLIFFVICCDKNVSFEWGWLLDCGFFLTKLQRDVTGTCKARDNIFINYPNFYDVWKTQQNDFAPSRLCNQMAVVSQCYPLHRRSVPERHYNGEPQTHILGLRETQSKHSPEPPSTEGALPGEGKMLSFYQILVGSRIACHIYKSNCYVINVIHWKSQQYIVQGGKMISY